MGSEKRVPCILQGILTLLVLATHVSCMCGPYPSDPNYRATAPSPMGVNCDPYNPSRSGYPPSQPSRPNYPPPTYSQSPTGYGYGYSYDRRMGQNPGSNTYNRYPSLQYYGHQSQNPNQFPQQQSHIVYPRITPLNSAVQGSRYPGYSAYQGYNQRPLTQNPYQPNYYSSNYPPTNYLTPRSDPYGGYPNQYPYQQYPQNPYGQQPPFHEPPPIMKEARAVMKGHPATSVAGSIDFCQFGGSGVRVKGRITGLPGGQTNKGLHILTDTDCPSLDQFPIDSKALEHFNPFKSQTHGHRDSPNKHAGDLGNIFVQYDGVSVFDFTADALSLDDPKYSIMNHSIVITEKEDDLGSNQRDPESIRVGNSGRAIACGKISAPELLSGQPGQPPMTNPWDPWNMQDFSRRDTFYASNPPMNYQFPNWK